MEREVRMQEPAGSIVHIACQEGSMEREVER